MTTQTTPQPAARPLPGSVPAPVGGAADPEPRPRIALWLRLPLVLVALLVATFAPVLIQLALAPFPGAVPWLNDPAHVVAGVTVGVIARILTTAVALVGAWLLVTRLDRRRISDLGVVWTRRSLPLLALGMAVSGGVVLAVATAFQGSARPVEVDSGPAWAAIVTGIAAGVLGQTIPEEVLFRGYVMQTMRSNPLGALAVSTLFFGALHMFSQGGQQSMLERVLYLATPVGFGFCAAALLLLTRSLWPALGIHAGLHLSYLVAGIMGISVESPLIWVVAGAGFVTVGLVALALWARRGGLREEVVIDR